MVTELLGKIFRITLLYEVSATIMLPLPSTAMPLAPLKVASVPTPLRKGRDASEPARVVTIPAGVILRILFLYVVSETYKTPAESKASANGLLNFALNPNPSLTPP